MKLIYAFSGVVALLSLSACEIVIKDGTILPSPVHPYDPPEDCLMTGNCNPNPVQILLTGFWAAAEGSLDASDPNSVKLSIGCESGSLQGPIYYYKLPNRNPMPGVPTVPVASALSMMPEDTFFASGELGGRAITVRGRVNFSTLELFIQDPQRNREFQVNLIRDAAAVQQCVPIEPELILTEFDSGRTFERPLGGNLRVQMSGNMEIDEFKLGVLQEIIPIFPESGVRRFVAIAEGEVDLAFRVTYGVACFPNMGIICPLPPEKLVYYRIRVGRS
jgi:hypothetical protein